MWGIYKRIINQSKIRWMISTFKPFKSAGPDGIVPALLQQGIDVLMAHLCHTFRAFLARGCIPKAWRQVNVMIIRRPRKANYTEAKPYFPTSLLSFVLKTMEKLVHRHFRDKILRLYVPYIDIDFPTNQRSPLKLHCVM